MIFKYDVLRAEERVPQTYTNKKEMTITTAMYNMSGADVPHWIMARSHLHLKMSRKSHERQFSQNGVGRDYLVVVMGSTWQKKN